MDFSNNSGFEIMRQLEVSWENIKCLFYWVLSVSRFSFPRNFDRRPKVSNEAGIFLWVTLLNSLPIIESEFSDFIGCEFFRPFGSNKVNTTAVTQSKPRQWHYHVQPGQA